MKGALGSLMQQAQKLQERLAEARREIEQLEVEGRSGGGMVRVVVNGRHQALRVQIEPELLGDDKEMLEDLIAAAFNDAVQRAEQAAAERMAQITGGLNLPPGMNLPF
ncbi:MAG: nucleoid-associated protein YbaB [Gammaproteobacteria bacterium]|nr:MAG: nucleoid-associated protein YbaB [Gammaproteobacteria bacterium]